MFTSRRGKITALLGMLVLLAVSLVINIKWGLHLFTLTQVWESLHAFDASNAHLLIRTVRIPAALIAAAVGASLAVAGTIMQGVTRNPLASPSLLGVNAGAVLAIVIVVAVLRVDMGMGEMVGVAFIGAALAALLVMLLGSAGRGGQQQVRLPLAGAAFAAFASAITSGIMLIRNESLSDTLFWLIGSVAGRKLEWLVGVLPYMGVGLLAALLLGRSLNIMALEEEVSRGLGQWTTVIKGVALGAVVLLAGASVALAGPIAFVGLIAPHVCRYLIGSDHRWLLPMSGLAGAVLLVNADLLSRLVLLPKQIPVGVTTALLGVPFLIYLARRRTTP